MTSTAGIALFTVSNQTGARRLPSCSRSRSTASTSPCGPLTFVQRLTHRLVPTARRRRKQVSAAKSGALRVACDRRQRDARNTLQNACHVRKFKQNRHLRFGNGSIVTPHSSNRLRLKKPTGSILTTHPGRKAIGQSTSRTVWIATRSRNNRPSQVRSNHSFTAAHACMGHDRPAHARAALTCSARTRVYAHARDPRALPTPPRVSGKKDT